ncbi:unnamed protein product [Microthlaspi erraticum]|uniref:Uncharacterized protein n=1 Tax=Microthlaspi erraticum TaxID=1685480 RepID=A0A6D2KD93_9BRAS|nr:unnamed protein product [Microthlaspi erraticum]
MISSGALWLKTARRTARNRADHLSDLQSDSTGVLLSVPNSALWERWFTMRSDYDLVATDSVPSVSGWDRRSGLISYHNANCLRSLGSRSGQVRFGRAVKVARYRVRLQAALRSSTRTRL